MCWPPIFGVVASRSTAGRRFPAAMAEAVHVEEGRSAARAPARTILSIFRDLKELKSVDWGDEEAVRLAVLPLCTSATEL